MLLVDIFVTGCLTVTTVLLHAFEIWDVQTTKILYYFQEEIKNTKDDQTKCLEIIMSVDRNESLCRVM